MSALAVQPLVLEDRLAGHVNAQVAEDALVDAAQDGGGVSDALL